MTQSSIPSCFIFNGDADGLISQHLVALSGVHPSLRITGLKREIVLLERIPPLKSANLYVFDISLESNSKGLLLLLENPEIQINWFDHHESGMIPDSPRLKTRIRNTRGTCTALIVHGEFPGSDPCWAAMAAFGDNVPEAGEALLRSTEVSESEANLLREAGELLNYNAYGETEADVLFHPMKIAEQLSVFRDPLAFIRESGFFEPLRIQFREDEKESQNLLPSEQRERARLYQLPAKPWSRRFGATFVNRIARENPDAAVAALHPLNDGTFQVSIRAPRSRSDAPFASDLAREFPTGGGRALAAGINNLSAETASLFQQRFFDFYA